VNVRYVVIVREPLPDDLTGAARRLAQRFGLPLERAERLLGRAPGPLTRPVPEREARHVAAVLRSAGLNVEVREGDANGRVMEWLLPELDGPGAAGTPPFATGRGAAEPPRRGAEAPAAGAGPGRRGRDAPRAGAEPARRDADAPASEAREHALEPGAPAPEPAAPAPGPSAPGADPRKSYVPGMTVTTLPRDPMKTTLERDPPRLERGALRRKVATAATLPALLTLLVTLLAMVLTLLPLQRAEEARRTSAAAHALAASVEGLSGGLPLTSPLMRAQLARVASSSAARLPGQGVDFLVLLDAEGEAQVAWYRGEVGEERLPRGVRAALEERARAGVGGAATAGAAPTTWRDALGATWRDLLALVGLAEAEPVVVAVPVLRAGSAAGMVLAGSEGRLRRADLGWALLDALLAGLVPVLFGVLAALSLTRGLTGAITYLLRATDRISHGDLERRVELRRDDELGQIARAVERMRLSLLEAMERLRRR